jgi:hypothetical protein
MGKNDAADLGRAAHAAYDKRDFSGPEATIADSFTWTIVPFGTGSAGVAGYREVMEAWSTAFSDSTATPTAVIEGGDQAAIEFVFSGTHDGVFPPRMAMLSRPVSGWNLMYAMSSAPSTANSWSVGAISTRPH